MKLKPAFKKFLTNLVKYVFFDREMLSKVIELCGCMQLIQADCLDVEYKSIKKTLEKIVYNDNIVRIEELALTIEKEGFYKENMIRFFDRTKEILKEKENSNAEKEDSLDMINI